MASISLEALPTALQQPVEGSVRFPWGAIRETGVVPERQRHLFYTFLEELQCGDVVRDDDTETPVVKPHIGRILVRHDGPQGKRTDIPLYVISPWDVGMRMFAGSRISAGRSDLYDPIVTLNVEGILRRYLTRITLDFDKRTVMHLTGHFGSNGLEGRFTEDLRIEAGEIHRIVSMGDTDPDFHVIFAGCWLAQARGGLGAMNVFLARGSHNS